jgi:hypothetical protein
LHDPAAPAEGEFSVSPYFHQQRVRVGSLAVVLPTLAMLSIGFVLPSQRTPLAHVSGRVTRHGQPVPAATICFDSGGKHCAAGLLRPDGSFELKEYDARPGIVPAWYLVHFLPRKENVSFFSKYTDSKTSGLEVDVLPDWNHLAIDLH